MVVCFVDFMFLFVFVIFVPFVCSCGRRFHVFHGSVHFMFLFVFVVFVSFVCPRGRRFHPGAVHLIRSNSNARNAIPSQRFAFKGKCLITSARKVSERFWEALGGFTLRLCALKHQSNPGMS